MITVSITLTIAGVDTGPTFSLYSNVDSYTTAFATGVTKAALQAGYISTVVPDGTTIVRVFSPGTCQTYVDLNVVTSTTTTTSTSTSTSTTTSTSTSSTTSTTTATPTTTTTTTTAAINYNYAFEITPSGDATMYLNNRPGVPNFTTSYNLVLVNTITYSLASNSIVAGAGKVIQKIERIAYDGVTVVQTITPGTNSFTFSTGQMVMDSAGVAPGFYETVKVTIV
jgi:hypothetical protein